MKQIPKVTVPGSITPTENGDYLDSLNLAPAVEKHRPYDSLRWYQFLVTEEGSIEELSAAKQLALQYLLQIAFKTTVAIDSDTRKQWTDRYTQASAEIYGVPESSRASKLLQEHIISFEEYKDNPAVDAVLLEEYLQSIKFYDTDSVETEQHEQSINTSEHCLEEVGEKINNYLEEKYSRVLEVFKPYREEIQNNPDQIKQKFDQAILLLIEIEPSFADWNVKIRDGKDSLSVDRGRKTIIIGKNRIAASDLELEGLFSHEVLVHVLRAINGAKTDKLLSMGLPDYIDAEEGLGTLFEFAITGQLPEKNADRYIDIAIASGVLNGVKTNRNDLLNLVKMRETLRGQANGILNKDIINSKVKAHVNRIYRGTPGGREVGVFTKDIAYQVGFDKIVVFISEQLEVGKNINDIIDYLLSGKFDPTNALHRQYVNKHVM